MDHTNEALKIWKALRPKIRAEIESATKNTLRTKKMLVTTAPNYLTGLIGVTEAFAEEMFIPYVSVLEGAEVGNSVIVYMYWNDASTMVAHALGDSNIPIGAWSICYHFYINNDGDLICEFDGTRPPPYYISEDGDLIYKYHGQEPQMLIINNDGYLICDFIGAVDGGGSVSSVCGVEPVDGNIPLTGENIPTSSEDETSITTALGNLKEEIDGITGGKFDLLWTNPSPNSAFGIGSVVNYTQGLYDAIGIIIHFSSTGIDSTMHIIPIGTNGWVTVWQKELSQGRTFTANSTSLTCSSGWYFYAPYPGYGGQIGDGNAYGIPYRVYGIKFKE